MESQYTLISGRRKNGFFAGNLSRNLYEIAIIMQKIRQEEISMREGVQEIAQFAAKMCPQHPILIAANKCKGLLVANDQYNHVYRIY